MAAKILNSIGSVGVGLAVTGGIINSALFNGNFTLYHFIGIILSFVNNAIKFYYKAS